MGIHDQTFRAFAAARVFLDAFLREQMAPSLVRQFAGPAEVVSDRFVDQHLKGTIADLVVRIPLRGGRFAFVYILLEHKRTQDRALAVQLLKYQASLYAWLAKQQVEGQPTPFVVTLVVYNGVAPWKLGRRFSEILGIPPENRGEALDFKVHVLDLASLRAASLSKHRVVRGALMALKVATLKRQAQQPLMREALRVLTDDHSTLATAVSYFQHIGHVRDVAEVLAEKEETTNVQTFVQYYTAKGRKEGLEKGIKKGIEKGIEKGKKQVLRSKIERLLGKRAGTLTETQRQRLATADTNALDAMLDALIDGRPLRTVFKT
ncbi:MAG: Rpn family recombination-promoting nuclease/putative transposase [Archangium sp.]|nr:Rpn family recombination-promoting nuclease/putative transposase [Archangium sp.]